MRGFFMQSKTRHIGRTCIAVALFVGFGAYAAEDTAVVRTIEKPLYQVFSELSDALLYHEDRDVREAAAHALGEIGGKEALRELEKAGFLDWPMWQYDAGRSANTPVVPVADLHLQWVRELPEPNRAWPHQWDDHGKLDFDVSYSPVVKGDRIFVPSNVTDSVTAYSINNGEELWRFYANGPVRLAPAVDGDRVYFVSDDGHLYCVRASDGALIWKFQGGPSDLHLLGNERIINLWAARGAPVIWDDVVYFTAGIWPLHGIFVYALDAASGEVVWINDTTSSDYVPLPHGGAYGYGGLAPQGYIAADEDYLVVSGGRAAAVHLDRHTGDVTHINPRVGKGDGGYAVHADGMGYLRNERLDARVEAVADQLDGDVFNTLTAHNRLFISTTEGTLYCFATEETEPVRHRFRPARLGMRSAQWARTAQDLLDELDESDGYALMLGAGSGDLMRELLMRSDLHIVVVEQNSETVQALRDELAASDIYSRRAAVIEADPATFAVQPYLFSMVLSEDAEAAGLNADPALLDTVLNRLRPYGAVAYLGSSADTVGAMVEAAREADVDQVHVDNGLDYVFAQRSGPLTGAGQWTHQLHDSANTLVSNEQRAQLPLGLLWYGGPNNHNILPRHAGGPRPQVAAGRQIYLGVENIAARCVYTGRQLWDKEYPGIGHPFTNLELEERWREGEHVYMTNIPGATYIGSPFVTLSDSVYLRYDEKIHRLDPATGDQLVQFGLPGRSVAELYEDDSPDWGHISVQGDFLITTAEPHIFEDQQLGWTDSYSGTSSGMLVVMDRFSGDVQWTKQARIGFRHNAIISNEDTLYIIDGQSENAVEHLARRGTVPDEPSVIMALDLATGDERWRSDSNVFGTFLMYSAAHDILIEGGSQDLRRTLEDEPREMTARRASDGEILWERGGNFTVPAAIVGDMLIPGRPGVARSILTGDDWMREQPHTGESSGWTYGRAYGCNTLNASLNLLLYRTGYAGFYDLLHDSGTGTLSGFRSGCTANMIPAEGLINALDYTRSCTCSYQQQTSLALIHMPGDSNIEVWTRYDAFSPDPEGFALNFGAPGRRVDESGLIWFDEEGTQRRHPSAITDNGGAIDWVVASVKEINDDDEAITIYDLLETNYTVRLHFAELDESVEPGQRVFNILINGEEMLNDFDVVDVAGGCMRGVVREFSVDSEMTMTVELQATEDSERAPVIGGIELIANGIELASAHP